VRVQQKEEIEKLLPCANTEEVHLLGFQFWIVLVPRMDGIDILHALLENGGPVLVD
jgi:hypothetical protein